MDGPVSNSSLPSRIAYLVHAHFDGLPKRSKPAIRDDGTEEWIPMTGIVIVKGENTPTEELICVTVTTGAKCLSASQIPQCKGLVLHDWHAEILAMRAFNYWLLSECEGVLARERSRPSSSNGVETDSSYIRRRKPENQRPDNQPITALSPPFEFHPDITIYMYCTCAPCGDASMELCMAAQDDPTPWAIAPSEPRPWGNDPEPVLLDGRAHFSRLGIVRRKPARADAEATKSKSCSDKIALRQVSSLLNHATSFLVAPTQKAYLAGIILPEEEITPVGCDRCFGEDGRMRALKGRAWPLSTSAVSSPQEHAESEPRSQPAFKFHPFRVLAIPDDQLKALWPFRKPKLSDPPTPEVQEGKCASKRSKPGTISAVWIRAPTLADACSAVGENGSKSLPVLRGSVTGLFENIINGVKQGHRAASPGLRGASALSRAKMWGFLAEIVRSSGQGQVSSLKDEYKGEEGPCEGLELVNGRLGVVPQYLEVSTYGEFKRTSVEKMKCIQMRKRAIEDAREVLSGWAPNTGDEHWGLDVLVDTKKRKR